MLIRSKTTLQGGFTIVELAVIVPIMMLVVGGLLAALINQYIDQARNQASVTMRAEVSSALTQIDSEAQYASSFLTTKDAAMTDPYGPDGSGGTWSYTGAGPTSRTLIVRGYATATALTSNSTKSLVYKNPGTGCTTPQTNPPLTTNVVYFVQNNTLYKRYLPETGATLCSSPAADQLQSCPTGSSNGVCVIDDVTLATGVTSFVVTYRDGASTFNDLAATPASVPTSTQANVALTISRSIGGQTLTETKDITISKRN